MQSCILIARSGGLEGREGDFGHGVLDLVQWDSEPKLCGNECKGVLSGHSASTEDREKWPLTLNLLSDSISRKMDKMEPYPNDTYYILQHTKMAREQVAVQVGFAKAR